MPTCPLCRRGSLRIVAAITHESVITHILRHLKLASVPPSIAPARCRQELFAELNRMLGEWIILLSFNGQTGVPHNTPYPGGIDRIASRNGENAHPVRQHNMCALAENAKTLFLEHSDSLLMIDSRELRHGDTTTATSRTSASGMAWNKSSTAARYSRIASWIFSSASASVVPCDQQPGRPGQETLSPSLDFCKTIFYSMILPLAC
jgi:hypothetical protein